MTVISTFIFTAGMLTAAHQDHLSAWWLVLLCFISLAFSLVGETTDYFIGHYGRWILAHFKWASHFLSEDKMKQGKEFLEKYGQSAIVMSRFMPGVKTVSSYAVGATGYSYFKYIMINVFTNSLIIMLCSLFGYYLGQVPFVKQHFIGIILCMLSILCLPSIWLTIKKLKEREKQKNKEG